MRALDKFKQKEKKSKVFTIIIILMIVLAIALICFWIWSLRSSSKIRAFKNACFVIQTEATKGFAEHDGKKVLLSSENLNGVGLEPERCKYRMSNSEAEEIDEILYSFIVNKNNWSMTVKQYDNDRCSINLVTNDTEYFFYFDDNGEFEKYLQYGSENGFVNKNKLIN